MREDYRNRGRCDTVFDNYGTSETCESIEIKRLNKERIKLLEEINRLKKRNEYLLEELFKSKGM